MEIVYGRSDTGNLAIALEDGKQRDEVWKRTELVGDYYKIVSLDELTREEANRIDSLIKLENLQYDSEMGYFYN